MIKFALIGEKLGHSLSKVIHDMYFEIMGMNAVYDMIEIPKDGFSKKLNSVLEKDYLGINVTIPYKIDVINHLDQISSEAKRINAVNTIYKKDNLLIGDNTDFYGLCQTFLRFGIEISNKDVVILGTGGASKAVYAACESLNAKSITYVSREKKQVGNLKTLNYSDDLSGDVIINTTPCGMYPNINESPIKGKLKFKQAVDLIYNPKKTLFLKQAESEGLDAVNGLYMLVAQAIKSQAIWNRTKVCEEVINKIYNKVAIL